MIGKQPTAFREVDMAQSRGILLASIVLGLSMSMDSAAAQKKYDPGATDSEIKIGNIMPYSGPLSAYALIGRTQEAFFRKLNAEGGLNGRKINFVSYDDGFSPGKDRGAGTQARGKRRGTLDIPEPRHANQQRHSAIPE